MLVGLDKLLSNPKTTNGNVGSKQKPVIYNCMKYLLNIIEKSNEIN